MTVTVFPPYLTGLVAENNGTTVIVAGKHYMMRSPDGAWSTLDEIDAGKP